MTSFLARFGPLVAFVLSGFDRRRFRGQSRLLGNARGVDSYFYQQNVRHVDFPKHARDLTDILCRETEAQAKEQGVPLQHLNSPTLDKEATALELARSHGRSVGPIGLLSSVELCSVYRLRRNSQGWVKPARETGKCLHDYHDFLHQDFGLCYARVQSWFPFTVRIGMNGRQMLYRRLDQLGLAYRSQGNWLLEVAAPLRAQELLDEQTQADWIARLDDLTRPVQPLWSHLYDTANVPYYWVGEQTEWATDFVFHSADELARVYPRFVRHGIEALPCKDVLRSLGKKVPAQGYGGCTGEAKIDLRERAEGTRLKFWYGSNSLKFYDKEQTSFRVETTINQPKNLKAYRTKEGAEEGASKAWLPLRKGVADLGRRAEISQSANNRLVESLATVAEPSTLGELLKPLGRPVFAEGRRVARALNPLTGSDGELLRGLARGEYLLQGFRNRDVRVLRYGETADAAERRR